VVEITDEMLEASVDETTDVGIDVHLIQLGPGWVLRPCWLILEHVLHFLPRKTENFNHHGYILPWLLTEY
jgi:hypothetical protein